MTERRSMEEILANPDIMTQAMQRAVRQALRVHKALGNPIAVWQDGRVVWIPPEEIPVSDREPPFDSPASRARSG